MAKSEGNTGGSEGGHTGMSGDPWRINWGTEGSQGMSGDHWGVTGVTGLLEYWRAMWGVTEDRWGSVGSHRHGGIIMER